VPSKSFNIETLANGAIVARDRCFTSTADAAARILIQNALFLRRKKPSAVALPWDTGAVLQTTLSVSPSKLARFYHPNSGTPRRSKP
jgi:hypothetical protein